MQEFNVPIIPYGPPVDPYTRGRYFSTMTITYGELVDEGYIDWNTPEFAWDWYDEEQRERVQNMIAGRFWMREIATVPPEAWRKRFIETLNEAMRTAKLMYRALDEQGNPMVEADEYHKGRTIGSEFPATLLNGSGGDYASDGRDTESETVRQGNLTDIMYRLQEFRHPDVYILERLEICFSSLVTVNVNAY